MELHHIGYYVDKDRWSIERLIENYERIGYFIEKKCFDEYDKVELVLLSNGILPYIELVTPAVEIKEGVKFHHLCYEVEDFPRKHIELRDNGFVLVSAARPAPLFDKKLISWFYSIGGLIELKEK